VSYWKWSECWPCNDHSYSTGSRGKLL